MTLNPHLPPVTDEDRERAKITGIDPQARAIAREDLERTDRSGGAARGIGTQNPILKFFNYVDLPLRLQGVAVEFYKVALLMNGVMPDSAEKSAGLRKLLEAKDCFVRAAME